MKRICWSLTILWLTVLLRADVIITPRAPEPSEPEKQFQFELWEGMEVRLKEADVTVQITPDDTGKDLIATVVCTFLLEPQQLAGGNEVTIGFPIAPNNPKPGTLQSFRVFVNGVEEQDLEPMVWKKPRTGIKSAAFFGYQWPLDMTTGIPVRLRVEYTLTLQAIRKRAEFDYLLTSGAMWSGTIGRERIEIRCSDRLKLEIRSPKASAPQRFSAQEIVWDFRDFEPTEDIQISIVLIE